MRLSIEKRLRLVTLYEENNLAFKKGRFHILKIYAARENIIASITTLRILSICKL
jgi:hypothetical protein